MTTESQDWFYRNTFLAPSWTVDELVAAKRDLGVSVVLPALNEEETVGTVVSTVVPYVGSLVDELVVMDSGSTDRTASVAAKAGARVVRRADVLPHLVPLPGKGEVLWRSLAATSGDVLVFVDSDLIEPDPRIVPALLGPLVTRQDVHLVKGFYRRPLRLPAGHQEDGGGRVTELLARPLLAALCPGLSGIVQPLGGEYAATRSFLETVSFSVGYGVEIGLLLDAYASRGVESISQVNLGVRKHRNRSLLELGVMAREILETVLGRFDFASQSTVLTQFVQVADEWIPSTTDVRVTSRPPMCTIAAP